MHIHHRQLHPFAFHSITSPISHRIPDYQQAQEGIPSEPLKAHSVHSVPSYMQLRRALIAHTPSPPPPPRSPSKKPYPPAPPPLSPGGSLIRPPLHSYQHLLRSRADDLEGCTGKRQGCRLGDRRRVHDRLARHIRAGLMAFQPYKWTRHGQTKATHYTQHPAFYLQGAKRYRYLLICSINMHTY